MILDEILQIPVSSSNNRFDPNKERLRVLFSFEDCKHHLIKDGIVTN